MAQTKREKAIHAKTKGSGTSMKYFVYGKEQTTNDPKIIEKLKANNRNEQGYYNRHFTPFENFLIAQGESAGEVYGHVYGNHYVTPEQRKMAKEALIHDRNQSLRANQGIDSQGTMYLEKLKKGERR